MRQRSGEAWMWFGVEFWPGGRPRARIPPPSSLLGSVLAGVRGPVFGVLVGIAFMCASPAWAATAHTAYITNDVSAGTVTPIDTATNTAGTAIPVGKSPYAIAITPDGRTAYVTNQESSSVTAIDTATNTPVATITVDNTPSGIAITPDGKTAYVTNAGSGTVTPIEVATNTPGTAITVGSGPDAIAITPDGKTAYVTNGGSGTVTPIDIATNTAGATIGVGSIPTGIAITPDGKTVYVANGGTTTVTPIDTATNTAGTPITVGNTPYGIAITADGRTAYVVNQISHTVTPIDTATNTPGTAITVGSTPYAIAITPDGKTVYVPNTSLLIPIDTATNTAGTAIGVGFSPTGVAVTPDQGPVAAFSATVAPAGQATSFDASASSDPDGTVVSYHWDFGDGQTATSSTPTTTHTYATAGSHTATLTVTDDAGCSTAQTFTGQTVSCNGSPAAQISDQLTVSKAASSTSLASSENPSRPGQSITLTATVTGSSPTGTVAFTDGASTIDGCGSQRSGSGKATCTTSALSAGSHSITAVYSGDANNTASTSLALAQTVQAGTALAPSHVSIKVKRFNGKIALIKVACTSGGSICTGKVMLRYTQTVVTRRHGKAHRHKQTVVLGSAKYSLSPAQSETIKLALNRDAKRLLERRHELHTNDIVTLVGLNNHKSTIAIRFKLTLKQPSNHHRHK